jgi:hypothetical protein
VPGAQGVVLVERVELDLLVVDVRYNFGVWIGWCFVSSVSGSAFVYSPHRDKCVHQCQCFIHICYTRSILFSLLLLLLLLLVWPGHVR